MRATACAWSTQVIDVPALFTRGRAAHCKPAAHAVRENLPLTHCANSLFTQAFSPAVHGEAGVSDANLAFSAWASLPFWRVNGLALLALAAAAAGADGAAAAEATAAGVAGEAAGLALAAAPEGVAPVAAIRAFLSASVVQATAVPALLTNGNAVQIVPPAQAVKTNLPFEH